VDNQKEMNFSAKDIRKVLLKDGVYICQDSHACEINIVASKVTEESKHPDSKNVEFFDSFTNHLIAANLGPDSILAETNHSDDIKWQRKNRYSGDSLFSCLSYNSRFLGSGIRPVWGLGSLEINTHIPGILEYYDMDRFSTILIFTVMSMVLLAGLFLSIKAIITRIFPGPIIFDRHNGHSGKENVVFQVIEDCLK
jgi:hypothetical protein